MRSIRQSFRKITRPALHAFHYKRPDRVAARFEGFFQLTDRFIELSPSRVLFACRGQASQGESVKRPSDVDVLGSIGSELQGVAERADIRAPPTTWETLQMTFTMPADAVLDYRFYVRFYVEERHLADYSTLILPSTMFA